MKEPYLDIENIKKDTQTLQGNFGFSPKPCKKNIALKSLHLSKKKKVGCPNI
jgi:hypothetical protein